MSDDNDGSTDDKATRNSILNNDLNTFTLNEQENELMDDLKIRIENLLSEYIGRLSKRCRKYLFNFLHQYEYDSETRQFNNVFIQSILLLFEHDLQEILSSAIVVGLSE